MHAQYLPQKNTLIIFSRPRTLRHHASVLLSAHKAVKTIIFTPLANPAGVAHHRHAGRPRAPQRCTANVAVAARLRHYVREKLGELRSLILRRHTRASVRVKLAQLV